ncbi:MAG TPA: bifunctional demethylmenaquinone methyltransferase/2-methoxy-6-polyprenyl-1,4-benzoquinol methylase UbiE [Bacillota bacterium]
MTQLTKDPETIRTLFDAIADQYDRLNTIMSLGIHHYWQKFAVNRIGVQPGSHFLDVCCGTGRITRSLAKKVGPDGKVIGLDLSARMLTVAKSRKLPANSGRVCFLQGDAQKLPFAAATFDGAIISYGLRNVAAPLQVLREMQRVVKPGGRIVSLELVTPGLPLVKQLYRWYLTYGITSLGRWVAQNERAYRYLCQSILNFGEASQITDHFHQLGLAKVECHSLSWGIAVVHLGTVT